MSSFLFNPKPSTIMHLDLNSCFASIEQQANPLLRGKPIAVAAYTTPNGCILAPSIEAKRYGVKTGMKVKEGKILCPGLIVLSPDPWKYRNVHLKLRNLLSGYTANLTPKSIDEFVLDLEGYPALKQGLKSIGDEIKRRIREEIGDWLKVSIGVAPNRYLAKVASNLKKPDGFEEINKDNFFDIYSRLKLTDLPYIKLKNAARLNSIGIHTVLDFYKSPIWKLKVAFESINGYYWYIRLRGFEIDDVVFRRRSFSNSYVLPKLLSAPQELSPILMKLVTKLSHRLRFSGYKTNGVHLALIYRDGSFWHKGVSLERSIFDTSEIYKEVFKILLESPQNKFVRVLSVSCFNLTKLNSLQLELFDDVIKKRKLAKSVDEINRKWGEFFIMPARMLGTENFVPDRIAFGGVKELEEFTFQG